MDLRSVDPAALALLQLYFVPLYMTENDMVEKRKDVPPFELSSRLYENELTEKGKEKGKTGPEGPKAEQKQKRSQTEIEEMKETSPKKKPRVMPVDFVEGFEFDE